MDLLRASFSEAPVVRRVRYGKNGVISKGIFSRAEVRATCLALASSTLSLQGSTLIRPPRGSAAIWSMRRVSSAGADASRVDIRMLLLVASLFPKRGRIRFG